MTTGDAGDRGLAGRAVVEEPLDEGEVGGGRRVVDGGDDPVVAVGERGHDGEAGGTEGE
ncbi:hypothetical protein ACIO93_13455 [Streptomyces sp. NPDC087903]|uniref:hypothetical protein n=1 Tax=Streptomyces sp. NPDC087903 TaxID=3365819 RepID=UPI0038208845